MSMPVAHYPLWLRLWHWTNALFFLALIVSGLALHYASPTNTILPFQTARIVHNFTGLALAIAYLVFLLGNRFTPNGKHYIPARRELTEGLWRQLLYYLVGIFRGDPHPHDPRDPQKFNPIQKLTYLGIMYVATPVVIVTGLLLLFPELAPRQIWNMPGVLPAALLHSALGFLLSMFLVGHVYLASTGETIAANYEAMLTGYRSAEFHPVSHRRPHAEVDANGSNAATSTPDEPEGESFGNPASNPTAAKADASPKVGADS
ncbi:MAG: cytochrome b/b6 domain-containing protein [Bryobacterales bacterium]|jgi:thiosulfate reductase cytochrome b subunit|nr:cytochrome b/b6 domain-containing protein [Bryobacterales bacterium]